MKLDSARNLKADVFKKQFRYVEAGVRGPDGLPSFVHPRALDAAHEGGVFQSREMGIALGFASTRDRPGDNMPDLQLVAILSDKSLRDSQIIEDINRAAKGELKVLVSGPIRKQAFPLDRERPLRMGSSVGHAKGGTGSLGCFVRCRGVECLLSNNHILALENRANFGDPVVQQARSDGGRDPRDRVATLFNSIEILFGGAMINHFDAAIAALLPDVAHVGGQSDIPLSGQTVNAQVGAKILKVGRQTIGTEGVVTAIEMDQVMVEYGVGRASKTARFDGQIAISGTAFQPFSKKGDSGAVVLDGEGHGVGLLFAGSANGGENGGGLSFANPLAEVLQALEAELIA
jgi:hypothetical protein